MYVTPCAIIPTTGIKRHLLRNENQFLWILDITYIVHTYSSIHTIIIATQPNQTDQPTYFSPNFQSI